MGKIDTNELVDSREGVKCPHCREFINFYYFTEFYATPTGEIKYYIEELYNADIDFMQYCLDCNFEGEVNDEMCKFIRKKLKEYYKNYKKGIEKVYKGVDDDV